MMELLLLRAPTAQEQMCLDLQLATSTHEEAELIKACLRPNPAERPTARILRQMLHVVSNPMEQH